MRAARPRSARAGSGGRVGVRKVCRARRAPRSLRGAGPRPRPRPRAASAGAQRANAVAPRRGGAADTELSVTSQPSCGPLMGPLEPSTAQRPAALYGRCLSGSRGCAPVFISFAYLPYLSTCNSCVRSASIRIVNVSMIRTPRPARRQHIRVRFGLCDAPRATQPAGATATVPLLSSPRHKPHSLKRSCFVREPLSQFACTSTGERRWAARHVALEYR